MKKHWHGKWLADSPFLNTPKLDLYHKERDTAGHPEHPEHLRHHHWYVRKSFPLTSDRTEWQGAVLDITGDDYYKVYVNGVLAAQGPAQSDAAHYYYNRVEVGSLLKPGLNVLAVHVYYQGLLNRAYNSADFRQGFIADLVGAGGAVLAASDGSWKAKQALENQSGTVFGYDTQFTEHIDARLSDGNWKEADYDDSSWPFAPVHDAADYTLILQPTPVLAVYAKQPVQVDRLAPGRFLIDFGEEITGQFTMMAKGAAGTTVDIYAGEELLDDGSGVRFKMRCNCLYHDKWILSGREDTFETFDYKGFRYVEVAGTEQALRPETFHAVVRHYPLNESSCTFTSSDDRMNRIFAICKNGVKYGSQENYVDCPTREKGQYLGDNTVIGHAHMLLSGDCRLYRKAIEQFARSSSVCQGLMAVVPGHLMQEIADFSLQWPRQLLEYYRYSGDRDFLEAMYPYAEGVLAHFRSYEREDGMLHNVTDKWNLVDWPEPLRDGYDFPLTRPVGEGCHNVINAFYLGCILTVDEIRRELGIAGDDRLAARIDSFVTAFYDPVSGLFVDREGSSHHALHSNVLPLLFGLAPPEAVPSIVSLIRRKRFACGVYFAYFVLQALAKAGEYSLLYELMSSEEERSWGNMLKEGATTCFEAWGKEQKWNTSLCHPWASSPVPLLIEAIIGLKPAAPGWTEIDFKPQLPESWTSFKLQVQVPSGQIRIAYRDGVWEHSFPQHVKVHM